MREEVERECVVGKDRERELGRVIDGGVETGRERQGVVGNCTTASILLFLAPTPAIT